MKDNRYDRRCHLNRDRYGVGAESWHTAASTSSGSQTSAQTKPDASVSSVLPATIDDIQHAIARWPRVPCIGTSVGAAAATALE